MEIGLKFVQPLTSELESKGEPERSKVKRLAETSTVVGTAQRLVDDAARNPDQQPLVPPTQLQTQAQPGQGSSTVAVTVRDVNGDGRTDAVVRDEATGASATLLADHQGRLDSSAVSLNAPTAQDIDRLATTGAQTGRRFLAADLDGDGKRQLAVKSGNDWISLGELTDTQSPAGDSPSADSAVEQAEDRFEWILGELSWLIPALAWNEGEPGEEGGGSGSDPSNPNAQPPMVGFVQMLSGNVDPNPLKAFDLNADNLGGLVMLDSMGGAVGAFDPFSVGMRVYAGSGGAGAPTQPGASGASGAGAAPLSR